MNMLEKNRLDFFLGVNAEPEPFSRALPLTAEGIYLIVSRLFWEQHFHIPIENLINLKTEISLDECNNLPFILNKEASTQYQIVKHLMDARQIRVNSILSISDYDISAHICRLGYTAMFCPKMILPMVIRENSLYDDSAFLYAFPIRGLSGVLTLELVTHRMVHYPRYITDAFQIWQDVVSSFDTALEKFS